MARNTRTFSDIDLNFTTRSEVDPVTLQIIPGDIYKKYDENAIKQAIKNLIMIRHYEKPFHPEIGSQVSSLLFEPFSPMLKAVLERSIINTITNYEPRVKLTVVDVTLNPDNHTVFVSIEFQIVNTIRPVTLNLTLQRTR